MNIVHVTHRVWPVMGGSERYVMEIARRQVVDGHTVTVVATWANDLSALWSFQGQKVLADIPACRDGVALVRLPVRALPLGRLAFPILRRMTWGISQIYPGLAMRLTPLAPWVPGLRSYLKNNPCDLLFAWNITLEGLSAAVAEAAKAHAVPWIAVPLLHLARPQFYTMPHQLELLSRADHIVTQTRLERDYLLREGKAYNFVSDRITVVGAGVCASDAVGADGQRFRQLLGLDDCPVVVSLGSQTYEKGSLHLLWAVRRLWEAKSRLSLVLVGRPEAAIRRAVQRFPAYLRSRCYVLGRVSEQDKWDALAAADVVAQPSRTESFGIVFLEAWLLKKPVIGARAGAVPDVVTHQWDGLLVDFGDVVGLADAIHTLMMSPHRAVEMGARGYDKVIDRYTWDDQYKRFGDVVNRTMAGSNRIGENT